VTDTAPLSDPLDFRTEYDDQTGSWRRADSVNALIEPHNRYGWKVLLPDSDTVHELAIARERGAWVGWCDCKGYRCHDGPCAHLITIRQGHEVDDPDANGDPIHVPTVETPTPTDATTDDRAMTDGGEVVEHAAGSDGRQFGRPEGRL